MRPFPALAAKHLAFFFCLRVKYIVYSETESLPEIRTIARWNIVSILSPPIKEAILFGGTMKTNKTISKVRTHVKKNKNVYLAGGGMFILGVTIGAGIVLAKHTALVDIKQIRVWSPGDNTTFVVAALGDPGNVVREIESGALYQSQNALAKALGASKSMVSRHLNGTIPDLYGKQYEVVGKAGTNLAS